MSTLRRHEGPLRASRFAALGLLFALQSCCTTAVWTAGCGPRNGNDVCVRIALTPFAVIVDLLTLPAQQAWFEGGCHRRCWR